MQQFTNMQNLVHKLDGTRSVTQAILQPNQNNIFTSGYSDLMDVVGVNYHEQDLLNEHKAKPAYKMIGTENHVDLQTWLAMRDNPGYAGQFLWTGIGYLGEGGAWPNIASPETCLIDRDGTIVTDGYQRASWWSQTPMVYMTRTAAARGGARAAGARGAGAGARGAAALPATVPSMDSGDADAAASRQPTPGLDSAGSDWNPSSLAPHNETVQVFSNCQSVELFLNGTSLGAKPKAANDSARTWTVNFVPGTLKAVGSNDGKAAATYELHTASRAAKVTLTNVTSAGREKPDAAADQLLPHDFDHVAAVHVSITDIDGTRIGGTTPEVTFKLTGPGKIAAVDNGAIDNHELFQGSQIRAVDGQCDVWIRSTANAGPITLTASAPGLADGAMTFTAAPGVNQK
jgi:beta-galactosidase